MPRKTKTPVAASCAECGVTFETVRPARFCSRMHQIDYGNRMTVRGKVLAPYVLAWVQGRGGGHAGTHPVAAKALSELTAIARTFVDEDKAAGRSPLAYLENVLSDGFLYMDRRRPAKRRSPDRSSPSPTPPIEQ